MRFSFRVRVGVRIRVRIRVRVASWVSAVWATRAPRSLELAHIHFSTPEYCRCPA